MPDKNSDVLEPRAVTRDLFSAAIGSVCCCYVGQPFDTVKVRMQTSPDAFSTVVGSTSQILRNEGITAFWKGAVPTSGGMILENCMAFGVNEALKRAFPDIEGGRLQEGPPSLWKPFAMGALTGCCSATVLLPSEIIKAKTQISTERNITSQQIVRQMISKQGMRSFFVGFDAQLCRDASFYALFFGGYELSCYFFRTYFPSMPDELNYFLSGGIAGMGGWLFAMPFDVPKTNVQSRYDTRVFGSYFPELKNIAMQRGARGLYAGLGPTLIRAFPANAALFLGVESGKKFFDNNFCFVSLMRCKGSFFAKLFIGLRKNVFVVTNSIFPVLFELNNYPCLNVENAFRSFARPFRLFSTFYCSSISPFQNEYSPPLSFLYSLVVFLDNGLVGLSRLSCILASTTSFFQIDALLILFVFNQRPILIIKRKTAILIKGHKFRECDRSDMMVIIVLS